MKRSGRKNLFKIKAGIEVHIKLIVEGSYDPCKKTVSKNEIFYVVFVQL